MEQEGKLDSLEFPFFPFVLASLFGDLLVNLFVILKGARHSPERVVAGRVVGGIASSDFSTAGLLRARVGRDRPKE